MEDVISASSTISAATTKKDGSRNDVETYLNEAISQESGIHIYTCGILHIIIYTILHTSMLYIQVLFMYICTAIIYIVFYILLFPRYYVPL